ncbi:hypothetical protein [Methanimicrococcus hacksteinii]|uniref:hypothetical protein n=1 Tax=Methanimicrococcus hacksteinii TaxID=3028293 RepID=UPI00298ED917|nr:hypothetical protein [Methanimicrococcus sp. At1]
MLCCPLRGGLRFRVHLLFLITSVRFANVGTAANRFPFWNGCLAISVLLPPLQSSAREPHHF